MENQEKNIKRNIFRLPFFFFLNNKRNVVANIVLKYKIYNKRKKNELLKKKH